MATKLKALYQRRKGRDLFDLWYVVKNDLLNLYRVFKIFERYCNHDVVNFTKDEFIINLKLKSEHKAFREDIQALLPEGIEWDFNEAYQFVRDNVIDKISVN